MSRNALFALTVAATMFTQEAEFTWASRIVRKVLVLVVSYPTSPGVTNVLVCIDLNDQPEPCQQPSNATADVFAWPWADGFPGIVVRLQQRLADGTTRWRTAVHEWPEDDLPPCWPRC